MFTKMTFAQFYCLLISVICLLLTGTIFFAVLANPTVLNNAAAASLLTGIFAAISGAFVGCYRFITGSTAGSQAKDIALANSVPVVAAPSSVIVDTGIPAKPELA